MSEDDDFPILGPTMTIETRWVKEECHLAALAARDAEIERLRKDAERWAWVRENGICSGDAPVSYEYGKDADAYVDAVIAAQKGE